MTGVVNVVAGSHERFGTYVRHEYCRRFVRMQMAKYSTVSSAMTTPDTNASTRALITINWARNRRVLWARRVSAATGRRARDGIV